MARKRKLTETQTNLLRELKLYMSDVNAMGYDELKSLTGFKSFDSSFNALIHKGYIKHCEKSWRANRNDFLLML